MTKKKKLCHIRTYRFLPTKFPIFRGFFRKVFQNWEHSQIQLTKRRENKAKLELANRTERIEAAQREIADWESKVQRCQQEFEEISKEIKREMERFDVKRVSEFKSMIVKYLEDSMAHQQQVISRDTNTRLLEMIYSCHQI